jgi:hypothetical protein
MLQLPHETERLARMMAARIGGKPEDVTRAALEREAKVLGITDLPTKSKRRFPKFLPLPQVRLPPPAGSPQPEGDRRRTEPGRVPIDGSAIVADLQGGREGEMIAKVMRMALIGYAGVLHARANPRGNSD